MVYNRFIEKTGSSNKEKSILGLMKENNSHFGDNMLQIMEDYIDYRNNSNGVSESIFRNRLKNLGKSKEQIQEILIEMEYDWKKEKLAVDGLKKGRKMFVVGILVTLLFVVFTILSSINIFIGNTLRYPIFVAIGIAVLALFKEINDIRMVKHRKKRRELKWKNW